MTSSLDLQRICIDDQNNYQHMVLGTNSSVLSYSSIVWRSQPGNDLWTVTEHMHAFHTSHAPTGVCFRVVAYTYIGRSRQLLSSSWETKASLAKKGQWRLLLKEYGSNLDGHLGNLAWWMVLLKPPTPTTTWAALLTEDKPFLLSHKKTGPTRARRGALCKKSPLPKKCRNYVAWDMAQFSLCTSLLVGVERAKRICGSLVVRPQGVRLIIEGALKTVTEIHIWRNNCVLKGFFKVLET